MTSTFDSHWDELAAHWSLRPGVHYLNRGSFGPSPREVVKERCHWYRELESEPMDFYNRRLEPALKQAAESLGQFLGTSGDNLIFVDNATVAMNIVARSVKLAPGDEVLLNDHEYGAVRRIWEQRCEEAGAKAIVAAIPTPLRTSADVVEPLFANVTERTRLIVVSHVTSPTAIIFPVAEITRRARALGIEVCIDGPHALAMCDVQLDALDCDYYCASHHKWLCAPCGSGSLYVHPRRQSSIRPAIVSWGKRYPPELHESWQNEFLWVGSRDPSAFLATPQAITFMQGVGIDTFRQRAHTLVKSVRDRVVERSGLEPLVPDDPAWYGPMISLPVPPGDSQELQKQLWERYQIEVLIVSWNGLRLVRPSCHLYTRDADLERLIEGLDDLIFRRS